METPQAEHDSDNKYDHLNYIHVETPQAEHDSDNKYDHLKWRETEEAGHCHSSCLCPVQVPTCVWWAPCQWAMTTLTSRPAMSGASRLALLPTCWLTLSQNWPWPCSWPPHGASRKVRWKEERESKNVSPCPCAYCKMLGLLITLTAYALLWSSIPCLLESGWLPFSGINTCLYRFRDVILEID